MQDSIRRNDNASLVEFAFGTIASSCCGERLFERSNHNLHVMDCFLFAGINYVNIKPIRTIKNLTRIHRITFKTINARYDRFATGNLEYPP